MGFMHVKIALTHDSTVYTHDAIALTHDWIGYNEKNDVAGIVWHVFSIVWYTLFFLRLTGNDYVHSFSFLPILSVSSWVLKKKRNLTVTVPFFSYFSLPAEKVFISTV